MASNRACSFFASLKNKRKTVIYVSSALLLAVCALRVGLLYQELNDASTRYAEQITQSINDALKLDARIMSAAAREIARENGQNIGLIESIITDEGRKSKTDLLSWTVFDWNNKYGQQLVNSEAGVLKKKLNIADREYFALAKQHPWEMVMGSEAIFGRNSQVWVIPLAFGITDEKGQFIGALVAGLDIRKIMQQIERLGVEKLSYYLLDKKGRIALPYADINKDADLSHFLAKNSGMLIANAGYQIVTGIHLQAFLMQALVLTLVTLSIGTVAILMLLSLSSATQKIHELVKMGLNMLHHKQDADSSDSLSSRPLKRLTEIMHSVQEQQRTLNMQYSTYSTFIKEYNEYSTEKLQNLTAELEELEQWIFAPQMDKNILRKRYDLLKQLSNNVFSLEVSDLAKNDTTDVLDVLNRVQMLFGPMVSKKDITLKLNAAFASLSDTNDLEFIYLNRFAVQYLIGSVLAHAVEFLPAGSLIWISVVKEENHVSITIEDNGLGITDGELELARKEFYGQHLTTIGVRWLPIENVSDCLEKIGGQLKRGARLEGGAVFGIRLPVKVNSAQHKLVCLHDHPHRKT